MEKYKKDCEKELSGAVIRNSLERAETLSATPSYKSFFHYFFLQSRLIKNFHRHDQG